MARSQHDLLWQGGLAETTAVTVEDGVEDEEVEDEEEEDRVAAAIEWEGSVDKRSIVKPQEEEEAVLTPRTKYNLRSKARVDEAGNLVNYLNMSSFRRQFQSQKGQVDMATFIHMMQKALSKSLGTNASNGGRNNSTVGMRATMRGTMGVRSTFLSTMCPIGSPQDNTPPTLPFELHSQELVARLIELFREIDLDGDGLIVWDEFTRYITDKATIFNGQPTTAGADHDVILHYYHQHNIDPLSRYCHKDYLDRVVAIPRRGYVAAIEQRSPVITFYSAKTGKVVNHIRCKAPAMSLAYVGEPERVLVTANADLTMVTWNLDEGPIRSRWQARSQWPTPSAQVALCWVPSQHLLYSGSTEGVVYSWDLRRREQRYTLKGHKDIVFDLLSMDNLHTVASASMDTTVGIWDTYLQRLRLSLTGHKKGVFSLAYNQDYRLLVSAGFDHEAYVWSPFVNTLLYKLKGHNASLVGTLAVEHKPELITADSLGYLKLWDLRTFQCLQTFTTDHESGDLNDLRGLTCLTHLVVDHHQPRVVVATKRIHFFDQLRIKSDPYTDDLPISVTLFNAADLTIITASGRNIKIWDGLTGSLRQAYLNLAKSDITAVCLDHRKRKMIVGDTTGHIDVFNHQTGQRMKEFDKLRDAVVLRLHYLLGPRQVIAAYNDGFLCIFDETPIYRCPMLMEFDPSVVRPNDLAALCVSSATSRVASASSIPGDRIYLWNPDTAKCDSRLDGEDDAQYSVVSMLFLDPAPLLAVACSDGFIRIWATWSIVKGRRSCILAFSNEQPDSYVAESSEDYDYPLTRPPSPNSPARTQPEPPPPSCGLTTTTSTTMTTSTWPHVSLRRHLALTSVAVLCMAWMQGEEALYTGDDCGRIRRWDLRRLLPYLEGERLLYRAGSNWSFGTATVKVAELGGREDFLDPSLIHLDWSLEGHEDAVLDLSIVSEPPALLSASSDQCAKMWTLDGRPVGTLIQGLPKGMGSPGWDLPFDVGPREEMEEKEVGAVVEAIKARVQRFKRRKTQAFGTGRGLSLEEEKEKEKEKRGPGSEKHFSILNFLQSATAIQKRRAEQAKEDEMDPRAAEKRFKSLRRESGANLPSLKSHPNMLATMRATPEGEEDLHHQARGGLPNLTLTFQAVSDGDDFQLVSPRDDGGSTRESTIILLKGKLKEIDVESETAVAIGPTLCRLPKKDNEQTLRRANNLTWSGKLGRKEGATSKNSSPSPMASHLGLGKLARMASANNLNKALGNTLSLNKALGTTMRNEGGVRSSPRSSHLGKLARMGSANNLNKALGTTIRSEGAGMKASPRASHISKLGRMGSANNLNKALGTTIRSEASRSGKLAPKGSELNLMKALGTTQRLRGGGPL